MEPIVQIRYCIEFNHCHQWFFVKPEFVKPAVLELKKLYGIVRISKVIEYIDSEGNRVTTSHPIKEGEL